MWVPSLPVEPEELCRPAPELEAAAEAEVELAVLPDPLPVLGRELPLSVCRP